VARSTLLGDASGLRCSGRLLLPHGQAALADGPRVGLPTLHARKLKSRILQSCQASLPRKMHTGTSRSVSGQAKTNITPMMAFLLCNGLRRLMANVAAAAPFQPKRKTSHAGEAWVQIVSAGTGSPGTRLMNTRGRFIRFGTVICNALLALPSAASQIGLDHCLMTLSGLRGVSGARLRSTFCPT
jgi:hypothetical protein